MGALRGTLLGRLGVYEENRVFANSVERAAAAKSGDLVERREPVGCAGRCRRRNKKLACREAAKSGPRGGAGREALTVFNR